jgi:hypothetical protein
MCGVCGWIGWGCSGRLSKRRWPLKRFQTYASPPAGAAGKPGRPGRLMGRKAAPASRWRLTAAVRHKASQRCPEAIRRPACGVDQRRAAEVVGQFEGSNQRKPRGRRGSKAPMVAVLTRCATSRRQSFVSVVPYGRVRWKSDVSGLTHLQSMGRLGVPLDVAYEGASHVATA